MSASLPLTVAAKRPVWPSLKRGFFGRCPNCGEGRIFRSYLKVNDACSVCGEELFHQRADDAPPYMTMLVVGHVVLGAMLTFEIIGEDLPFWAQMAIWPTLALVTSLVLLPMIKGALIAYQWALRMHGFENRNLAAVARHPL